MKQPVALAYGIAGTFVAAALIAVTASTSGLTARSASVPAPAGAEATVAAASALPVIPLTTTSSVQADQTVPSAPVAAPVAAPAAAPAPAAPALIQSGSAADTAQPAAYGGTDSEHVTYASASAGTSSVPHREHEGEHEDGYDD